MSRIETQYAQKAQPGSLFSSKAEPRQGFQFTDFNGIAEIVRQRVLCKPCTN